MNLSAVATLTQIAIALTGLSRDSKGVIQDLADRAARATLLQIEQELMKGIPNEASS